MNVAWKICASKYFQGRKFRLIFPKDTGISSEMNEMPGYTLPVSIIRRVSNVNYNTSRGATTNTSRMSNRIIVPACSRCYRVVNYSQNHAGAR